MSKSSGTAQMSPCMWSPDGLGGHEILVCDKCWKELDREAQRVYWHTLHD